MFVQDVGQAYHVRALDVFGPDLLGLVPPNKVTNNSLTVSHSCGVRHCCTRSHLLIEPKWVNDERTHCHFLVISLIHRGASQEEVFRMVDNIRSACPHMPKCFAYLGGWSATERVIHEPAPRSVAFNKNR